ncbi:SRPBCC domain-containing protein [Sphingosinicella sp. LHD-64]|uniref:SRPBCC family protein n=1 Tax=Sphingosinicella sp. LHD-64 TaxID=3072139 RepID=UPI00280D196B|nr:SRPBCC domain-containing protein [Sphingosinicella sp. LHD-64]MDQ8758254.1 SRPBCC domain-containing protein [Sphingosinicella sp. LHD-64]
MPVTTDEKGRRALEVSVEVPGTPEQVWQAIATGPGYGAWFVPTDLEEHVGGKVTFHLGAGMDSVGEVTEWQPPVRVAFVEPGWSETAPPLTTEVIVEALGGGICRVRMVHSIPSGDTSWDDEIGSMETGWPGFFEVLKIYLRHFAGQKAASARPMVPFAGTVAEAWADICERLGLAGVQVGEHRRAPDGAPPLAGIVERAEKGEQLGDLTMRLEAPAPGVAIVGVFAWGDQTNIGISLFFYGGDCEAVAARETARWEAWLKEIYPAPAEA